MKEDIVSFKFAENKQELGDQHTGHTGKTAAGKIWEHMVEKSSGSSQNTEPWTSHANSMFPFSCL